MLDKITQIYLKFSAQSGTGYDHSGPGRGGLDETEVGCLATAVTVDHVVPVVAHSAGHTPGASIATEGAGGT